MCSIAVGTRFYFRFFCRTHFEELLRLRRDQAWDWSRSRIDAGFKARMYYATLKGHRSW